VVNNYFSGAEIALPHGRFRVYVCKRSKLMTMHPFIFAAALLVASAAVVPKPCNADSAEATDPNLTKVASDDFYVMLFQWVPETKEYRGTGNHLVTVRVELSKRFSVFLRDGNPRLDGVISTKGEKLHGKVKGKLGSTAAEFVGLIEADVAFMPSGGLSSGGITPFYFVVTENPMSHIKKKGDRGR